MFDSEIEDLDARDLGAALVDAQRDLVTAECRQLALAAHWIDVYAALADRDAAADAAAAGGRSSSLLPGRPLPGRERRVRVGAHGTPLIGEFAAAEFATLQDMHPLAGANLLAKVANLRHRHPRLWARVHAGEVRGWKALEVARITGKTEYALTWDQARVIDVETYQWITTLPWTAFLDLLEARIIAADPDAAEARAKAAAAERFVATGRSTEYGLKTLIAKATAGDVLLFTAACDRIAQVLADRSDDDPVGARRAKALAILATPAHAVALLAGAGDDADNDDDGDPPENNGDASGEGLTPEPEPEPEDGGPLRPGDLHPSEDDADDTEADTATGTSDDVPVRRPCASCGGAGTTSFDPVGGAAAFTRQTASTLGRSILDPSVLARLRPTATLYVHTTQEALTAGRGVAHVEGIGVLPLRQACDLLGHRNVRLTEVIDLNDRHAVNGYAYRGTTREAVHLTSPRDVFPYGVCTSRSVDIDHPIPYQADGPPGQTNTGNAAPMVRRHHRLKTHAGWRVRQPEPGVHLWRSPHGWYFLVDHTGTHRLARHTGELFWRALEAAKDADADGPVSR